MKKLLLTTLTVLFLMVGIANADCDRCSDSRNACVGDHVSEVKSKCGEPIQVINYYNVFNQVVQYEFVYDIGSGKFPRYILFDAFTGNVIGIGTGSKRSK